jgi:hypothetical protein
MPNHQIKSGESGENVELSAVGTMAEWPMAIGRISFRNFEMTSYKAIMFFTF